MKFSQFFFFFLHFPHTSIYWSQLRFLSLLFIFTHLFFVVLYRGIPYGLAVRIPGFHPGGPGSTPGMGIHFLSLQTSEVLFLSFYQALRLKLSLSKWNLLSWQLCYENFLTSYDSASEKSTVAIDSNVLSTIHHSTPNIGIHLFTCTNLPGIVFVSFY